LPVAPNYGRLCVKGRSPEGTIFIPFHFAEAAANELTDNRLDARAKIPDNKMCSVRIAKAAASNQPLAATPLTDRVTIKDPIAA
jgi:predicted molibdopterin-dependent oxidoreductase YjgC